MRWQATGGWDLHLDRVEVASFLSPEIAQGIECFAGPSGSTTPCDRFEIGHTRSVHALTFGVRPGERVQVALRVPAGTVPSNAVLDERFSFGRSFSLNPPAASGWRGWGCCWWAVSACSGTPGAATSASSSGTPTRSRCS